MGSGKRYNHKKGTKDYKKEDVIEVCKGILMWSDFYKNYKGMYEHARRNGYLKELKSKMVLGYYFIFKETGIHE